MITRDRNYPSTIVWGVMPNEAGEHLTEYTIYSCLHADDSSPGQVTSWPTAGQGTACRA